MSAEHISLEEFVRAARADAKARGEVITGPWSFAECVRQLLACDLAEPEEWQLSQALQCDDMTAARHVAARLFFYAWKSHGDHAAEGAPPGKEFFALRDAALSACEHEAHAVAGASIGPQWVDA